MESLFFQSTLSFHCSRTATIVSPTSYIKLCTFSSLVTASDFKTIQLNCIYSRRQFIHRCSRSVSFKVCLKIEFAKMVNGMASEYMTLIQSGMLIDRRRHCVFACEDRSSRTLTSLFKISITFSNILCRRLDTGGLQHCV